MKKQTLVFTSFCLTLTSLVIFGYSELSTYLNRDIDQFIETQALKKDVETKLLQISLLQNQIEDLKNSFISATAAPESLASEANAFSKLRVESVQQAVRSPASVQPMDLSALLFAKGKESFLNKNYSESAEIFDKIIQKYPMTSLQVESYFFLAESHFMKKDFRSALRVIDFMMTNFPDNDLTGYIMLRMGQISESQQKADEAQQIYKTVVLNFKNPQLLKQAQALSDAVTIK